MLAPPRTALRDVEGVLEAMPQEDLQRLEQLTRDGLVPLDRLDPQLSAPMLRYLQSFSTYQLGRAADRYHSDMRAHAATPVRYGANAGGSKQFMFRLGSGFLSVAPE